MLWPCKNETEVKEKESIVWRQLIAIVSASVWLYCLCRVILGVGRTATFILIPMYVGEIAHKDKRGRYSYYLSMFLAMGLVYSYIVGPYFSTRVYTLLCTVPILLSLVLILLVVPETPYFLMAKNRPKHEVAKVLGKLRRSSDLDEEMKQIEEVELGYEFVSVLAPVPFTCLVQFAVVYSLGLGSVPFVYLSEFFPQHTKNIGVLISNAIGAQINVLLILVFPYFMEYLGMQWMFWLFSVSCFGCAIFTKYVVPETKGKTLEEIQRILEGRLLFIACNVNTLCPGVSIVLFDSFISSELAMAKESLVPETEALRNEAYRDEHDAKSFVDKRKCSIKEKGTTLLFASAAAGIR
ncbi:unnamed protein product [Callosobruchus maculatus]|uniref:Major facilitator superfamily (MFS) profile domain-containing protein n=1 Tax=Callosobruchus maculatus TaxID=64391 RepID=A0A653DR13_CALMS|nr:unnamed protein product [Callosobruchus maculatus]